MHIDTVTVVVETPKGSGQKYDYDPQTGMMKLKKIMPLGLIFPFDFGFIPGTVGGDGDPLDVLIISETSTFAGCLVDCRIIGGLKVIQQEQDGKRMRNDRLIAVPAVSLRYAEVNALRDLSKTALEQIVAFFTTYNEQAGKKFSVLEKLNAVKAIQIIEKYREELPMRMLVEVFLPLYDGNGNLFPEKFFTHIKNELTIKFGGVTLYSRSPVKGFWNSAMGSVQEDDLLVFEVMCTQIDTEFWERLKTRLMKTFKQESLIVRYSKIALQ
jgi:inorganic pyrophosphatase